MRAQAPSLSALSAPWYVFRFVRLRITRLIYSLGSAFVIILVPMRSIVEDTLRTSLVLRATDVHVLSVTGGVRRKDWYSEYSVTTIHARIFRIAAV